MNSYIKDLGEITNYLGIEIAKMKRAFLGLRQRKKKLRKMFINVNWKKKTNLSANKY